MGRTNSTPPFFLLPGVQIAVKASDETVNNSAVLQDDDELSLPVQAGFKYLLTLYLLNNSSIVADLKIKWSAPGGTALSWYSLSSVVALSDSGSGLTPAAITNELTLSGNAANRLHIFYGVLTITTSGTFKLQWAQNAQEVSDTKVLANSYLLLQRIQ